MSKPHRFFLFFLYNNIKTIIINQLKTFNAYIMKKKFNHLWAI